MARQVFFSFHYERDAWRAGQVRNCNLLPTNDQHGFIDSVDWESIKRQGEAAIKKWIEDQLNYTTVTVVLIGAETAGRPWVQHEIVRSWNRGNGVVGVRIHNIKDQNKATDATGANPFDQFKLPDNTMLSSVCRTYDWVLEDGRNNLGKWCEEAVAIRDKYGSDDRIVAVSGDSKNVIPRMPASNSFTPRSPWCADHAQEGR